MPVAVTFLAEFTSLISFFLLLSVMPMLAAAAGAGSSGAPGGREARRTARAGRMPGARSCGRMAGAALRLPLMGGPCHSGACASSVGSDDQALLGSPN